MATLNTSHINKVERYYKYHSRIYDATRWGFLFGRKLLLSELPDLPVNPRILEVGCGTGKNIEILEYLFPDAKIFGIDLSTDMLEIARIKAAKTNRIILINSRYGSNELELKPFDLVLLSYSLTMTGSSTESVLQRVLEDLKPNGKIAVVDFHNSPFQWFRRWMGRNHVNMNGQLLPLLNKYFTAEDISISKAYLGLWQYFTFIGRPT